MKNDICKAFDGIRADESLKEKTYEYLQRQMQKEKPAMRRKSLGRRLALPVGALMTAAFALVFSLTAYYAEAAYLDVDINPAIALTINRFDRVIAADGYTEESTEMVSQLALKHKSYEEAVRVFTDAAVQNGWLADGGLVSITVETGDQQKMESLLLSLQHEVEIDLSSTHHVNAEVDVFAVDSETRTNAQGHHISPAKYLAIQSLQAVDPTATLEGCRGHSIGEIRSWTQTHESHGEAGGADSGHHGTSHH